MGSGLLPIVLLSDFLVLATVCVLKSNDADDDDDDDDIGIVYLNKLMLKIALK